MTESDSPRLIGRKEAAAYLGISESTFSLWVATYKMPPCIPGTRKWDRRAIDAKLDEISGLGANDGEDPYDKWMRENSQGSSAGSNAVSEWRAKKLNRQAKYRPQMGLGAKLERVLLEMAAYPERDTVASIAAAGPVLMDQLIEAGAVRLVGLERDAFRYALTEEGRDEAKRITKWRALAP
ncbi:helix-turn-helix transcriptional regulator [Rhizobium multihospitium]|uniref:Uncharacterized protein n=1 Tax=Rhizobium multihospitium TaxID=410764 RepID=A0A1C3WNN0_9HYPH|nr:hypothetical protein [Rhizobium multihospitium]SCB41653.1 hypothetical protein GA0061103_5888 [Rhizobium multihospitium]